MSEKMTADDFVRLARGSDLYPHWSRAILSAYPFDVRMVTRSHLGPTYRLTPECPTSSLEAYCIHVRLNTEGGLRKVLCYPSLAAEARFKSYQLAILAREEEAVRDAVSIFDVEEVAHG